MNAPTALLVRRAREDAALTQRALASAAGLRQPNLSAIESGAREPSPDLLARILRAARLRPSISLEMCAEHIRALGAEHGLRDIRVFGSIVNGTDTERSDIDLLVSADDGIDFFAIAAFRDAAQAALGFPVDVVVDDGDDEVTEAIRSTAVSL